MTLDVIPSIDLLAGQVVRLERGDYAKKTVYSDDPIGVAMDFEAQGATRIHVVDLDGAASGEPANAIAIGGMIQRIAIPLQIAGGIRTIARVEELLSRGVDRVVLGTKALTDESFLVQVVNRFPDRVIVAPDAKDRVVHVSGWTQSTGEDVVDVCRRLAGAGVRRLLVTDIATDGMLAGPNVELFRDIAAASGVPVIASGGVASTDDVRALAAVPGVEAAIIGRALYVKALDLGDAIKAAAA
jgi:phosphoribosylformimino-5-aminoimidazole carboxamide ribotide isomerase